MTVVAAAAAFALAAIAAGAAFVARDLVAGHRCSRRDPSRPSAFRRELPERPGLISSRAQEAGQIGALPKVGTGVFRHQGAGLSAMERPLSSSTDVVGPGQE